MTISSKRLINLKALHALTCEHKLEFRKDGFGIVFGCKGCGLIKMRDVNCMRSGKRKATMLAKRKVGYMPGDQIYCAPCYVTAEDV